MIKFLYHCEFEKEIAEQELSQCPAHNFDHVMRVYNLAVKIAKLENADLEVIEAAAILHDIGGEKEMNDPSGKTDHAVESSKMAEPILRKLGYAEGKIRHIQDCILSHRYRNDIEPITQEAKIIFDADKLETLGAIGIARAFVWTGKNRANIYKKVNSIEEYAQENLGGSIKGRIQDKTKHSPQINWETKDKYIIELLHTKTAKQIAKERMKFSLEFFDRLERKIKGEI